MMEKEKQRQKELQDKIYEERAAKLWEIEYQKKINEQRELHLKKVSDLYKVKIIFTIYSWKRLKEEGCSKLIPLIFLLN